MSRDTVAHRECARFEFSLCEIEFHSDLFFGTEISINYFRIAIKLIDIIIGNFEKYKLNVCFVPYK